MPGLVIAICVAALLAWSAVAMVAAMRRHAMSKRWWALVAIWSLAGLAVGVWCGFGLEYQPRARYRVRSAPLPVVVFHLEEGQWVDFVAPEPLLNAVVDVIIVWLLSLLFLRLALMLRARRHPAQTV